MRAIQFLVREETQIGLNYRYFFWSTDSDTCRIQVPGKSSESKQHLRWPKYNNCRVPFMSSNPHYYIQRCQPAIGWDWTWLGVFRNKVLTRMKITCAWRWWMVGKWWCHGYSLQLRFCQCPWLVQPATSIPPPQLLSHQWQRSTVNQNS